MDNKLTQIGKQNNSKAYTIQVRKPHNPATKIIEAPVQFQAEEFFIATVGEQTDVGAFVQTMGNVSLSALPSIIITFLSWLYDQKLSCKSKKGKAYINSLYKKLLLTESIELALKINTPPKAPQEPTKEE